MGPRPNGDSALASLGEESTSRFLVEFPGDTIHYFKRSTPFESQGDQPLERMLVWRSLLTTVSLFEFNCQMDCNPQQRYCDVMYGQQSVSMLFGVNDGVGVAPNHRDHRLQYSVDSCFSFYLVCRCDTLEFLVTTF